MHIRRSNGWCSCQRGVTRSAPPRYERPVPSEAEQPVHVANGVVCGPGKLFPARRPRMAANRPALPQNGPSEHGPVPAVENYFLDPTTVGANGQTGLPDSFGAVKLRERSYRSPLQQTAIAADGQDLRAITACGIACALPRTPLCTRSEKLSLVRSTAFCIRQMPGRSQDRPGNSF